MALSGADAGGRSSQRALPAVVVAGRSRIIGPQGLSLQRRELLRAVLHARTPAILAAAATAATAATRAALGTMPTPAVSVTVNLIPNRET